MQHRGQRSIHKSIAMTAAVATEFTAIPLLTGPWVCVGAWICHISSFAELQSYIIIEEIDSRGNERGSDEGRSHNQGEDGQSSTVET